MSQIIATLDNKGLREFGLLTGAITAGLFGLLLPWLFERAPPYWPWMISVPFWLLAFAYPPALRPIHYLWMRIGLVLGWVNTRILLGLVFYMLFTPISLLLKLLNKDPMNRHKQPESDSYRIMTAAQKSDHMEKPY